MRRAPISASLAPSGVAARGRAAPGLPAFVTLIVVPLTYSIAHGIGYGLLTYVILAVGHGKARKVHPLLYAVAAAFAVYFWTD